MSQTFSEKKNFLLKYSDCDNRATIADSDTSEDSVDEKNQKFKDKKNKLNKVKHSRQGITIINGKIVLQIAGYKGLKTFAISELVHFIPVNNLKLAGGKLLRFNNQRPNKKKRTAPLDNVNQR